MLNDVPFINIDPNEIENEYSYYTNMIYHVDQSRKIDTENYRSRGLNDISYYINGAPWRNFEYFRVISTNPYTKEQSRYFVSIYEPVFIVDDPYNKISTEEKDVLNECISNNWKNIVEGIFYLYKENHDDLGEFDDIYNYNASKRVDTNMINFSPPDYRLLHDDHLNYRFIKYFFSLDGFNKDIPECSGYFYDDFRVSDEFYNRGLDAIHLVHYPKSTKYCTFFMTINGIRKLMCFRLDGNKMIYKNDPIDQCTDQDLKLIQDFTEANWNTIRAFDKEIKSGCPKAIIDFG